MFCKNLATDNKLTNNCPDQQQAWKPENVECDQQHPIPDPNLLTPNTGACLLHPKILIKFLLFNFGMIAVILAICAICEFETQDFHFYHWSNALQGTVLGPIAYWIVKLENTKILFYSLLVIYVVVFGLRQIKSLDHFMYTYFTSHPSRGAVYLAMFLSTFNHSSIVHLGINMYGLHNFMLHPVKSLGTAQFIAMYLSAGIFSNLTSNAYKVIFKRPCYSVGSSGAIMAAVGYQCTHDPDIRYWIIGMPQWTYDASTALMVLIGFEVVGAVLKLRYFDHAAHLGGALFGMFWCYWGSSHIWEKRAMFLHYYATLKGALGSCIF